MSRYLVICFALVLATAVPALAQFAPVSGTVEMLKPDGTKEPVAGAVVEVYRTDMGSTYPAGKTGKKGDFAFAGLPAGGVFTFAVSCPSCSPLAFPGIRAGQDKVLLTVSPGSGGKLTEAQVRSAASGSTDGTAQTQEMTAEQKKAQEEYLKQKAEVEAKNAKILKNSEIIKASLQAGNDAFNAKNMDLAITKYNEGLEASQNFIGSAPVLLNNLGAAYDNRAVETYNKARSQEGATKAEMLGKVKSDIAASIGAYMRAWQIYQTAPASDIQDAKANEDNKGRTLRGSRDVFKHAVATERVDNETIESAKTLLPEYEKIETDSAKKVEGTLILADLYRVAQDPEKAAETYKKVLAASPDNLDATGYLGLVLVDMSWLKDNDKALAQEGANYLLKFVSAAPDSHVLKEGAKGYLDILKTQSVVPVKTTPTKKKP